jgi:hypothetical protein
MDWRSWHDGYLDPSSDLSQRLQVVQRRIREVLDAAPPGPIRFVSACAGQGGDVAGAATGHPRAADLVGALVEFDDGNCAVARAALARAGLGPSVRVVQGDAGVTDAYEPYTPADLVLLCGVFGNVSDADVRRTIEAVPSLCAPAATVIWTRHRKDPDLTLAIRSWFTGAGFAQTGFTSPGPGRFAVGSCRLTRPPRALEPGARLFTFLAPAP